MTEWRAGSLSSDKVFGKYTLGQIDIALKIGIANMYLHHARGGSVGEKELSDYANASSISNWGLRGWFVMIDRKTGELNPAVAKMETPNSSLAACRSIKSESPTFWMQVYARLHIPYDGTSPRANDAQS